MNGGYKPRNSGPPEIVVIEQWICFLLGIVCLAFGVHGIRMECDQVSVPAYVSNLGLAYEPTLRGTAILCLGVGVALVTWALKEA